MDVTGNAAGKYDVLNISGAATLGGTLTVNPIAYTPQATDLYTLLKYASSTGTITNLFLTGFPSPVFTPGATSATFKP
jgi:hypothetical protein